MLKPSAESLQGKGVPKSPCNNPGDQNTQNDWDSLGDQQGINKTIAT